ncbi:hypothetical protein GSI_05969 [Ganoderma sinense ZZ0214-1]|uniref:CBM21 domain-containing protein n=1 Tax=Ganoderma sinense ZZ0214-1 TaxID=1077348 RepID=A0A2G8SBZ8_9APHY|nr:hypothetical protein GSI_05969 [Ganoderma sinense ZZ0214-1]
MPYAGPSDPAPLATATRPAIPHRRTRSSSNFSDERGPGAFAGLGQLPRLNKKAVFHINDNDDDNTHDDDRPSYTSYPASYNPLNSLRLSIDSGKFSPAVEPPPRIEIPPSAVPFPTSSPSSPLRRSPLLAFASSRTSSKISSSLTRTPSTPVILSNGKPLKSSLKSSASSPTISELPTKHVRAQSAPATPSLGKNVHFAEKDSGLETIRVFNRTGKPASLSKPPGEETETETEAESSSYPFPVLSTTPIASTASATLLHEIDSGAGRTSAVPKSNPSPYANVFLETLALPRTRPPTLRGTVLVRNIAFEKVVAVRFTLDDWQTTSEVMCKHVVSLPGLPPPFPRPRTLGDVAGNIATGQPAEDDHKEGSGLAWDRFSFTIRLEDYESKLSERTLFLVVRYNPGGGGEWWDNNDGANYRTGFRRVAASPLPSPAIGVAHSQQRTFSAPSTLRTTPTTASVSPYAPPTRQLAPAPPQLTRSISTPLPTLGRDQSEQEKMSEKGLGSSTAAYLSRKLSFSNYVAPSAQASSSSMVTPPTTPPGTIRIRTASLPVDAGLNADAPKEEPAQPAKDEKRSPSPPTRPPLTYRPTAVRARPAASATAGTSSPTYRAPSPSATSPPILPPLSSIPGPSVKSLSQAQSYGPSSYGFGFDGGSSMGYARPQLLSPPHSKESSPTSSGTASPLRPGSPSRSGSALGLEVPSPPDADKVAAVATLTNAVRELGLNASAPAQRVDTSDPTYAALLKQWCFAQSSPPAANASSGASPAAGAAATPRTGALETPPAKAKVGFGVGVGYGFPGFSFGGLPDAGMVGGE